MRHTFLAAVLAGAVVVVTAGTAVAATSADDGGAPLDIGTAWRLDQAAPATTPPAPSGAGRSTEAPQRSTPDGGTAEPSNATSAPATGTTSPGRGAPTSGAGAVSGGELTQITAGSYTGSYRLWAGTGSGVVVYFDGTGEFGVSNPDSPYVLGGSGGLVAAAAAKGMSTLALVSPDQSCKCWHTGDPAGYADWAAAVIAQVGGSGPVWAAGFSSGSQLITGWLVPQHPDLLAGWVVAGGGRPPADGGDVTLSGVRGHWVNGTADTEVPLDASWGAAAGEQWYAAHGVTTSHEWLEGVGHTVEPLVPAFTSVVGG